MTRRRLGAIPATAALFAALLLAPVTVEAKNLNFTRAVNSPIPDATDVPPPAFFDRPGILTSTIDVGKQGKAKKVRDVNVTVQTLGVTGLAPATNLRATLTGPTGAQTMLFSVLQPPAGASNLSIGPLTLDDEAPLTLGNGAPVNRLFLYQPWAGAATPVGNPPLAIFDDGPAAGAWTLTMRDLGAMNTSSLVSWRLNIVTGKAFKTK